MELSAAAGSGEHSASSKRSPTGNPLRRSIKRSLEYPCVLRFRHRRLLAYLSTHRFDNAFESLALETDVFFRVDHLQGLARSGSWLDAIKHIARFVPSNHILGEEGQLFLNFVGESGAAARARAAAPGESERTRKDKAEANLWIAIFSYVGSYFWTHYFFTVLGASYTFPSWRMNNVPHITFLLAHACFLFYHMFPYYEFIDRHIMYKVGSLFSAIDFVVSFPMFSRIDEKDEKWNLSRVAVDSLGAAIFVTIILEL